MIAENYYLSISPPNNLAIRTASIHASTEINQASSDNYFIRNKINMQSTTVYPTAHLSHYGIDGTGIHIGERRTR